MKRYLIALLAIYAMTFMLSCGGRIAIKNFDEWNSLDIPSRRLSDNVEVILHKKITISSKTGNSVVAKNGMLFTGSLKGYLDLFELSTGKKKGGLRIRKMLMAQPIYDDSYLYFTATEGRNTLFAYDIRNGMYLWKKKLGVIEQRPALRGKVLCVAKRNGQVFAINRQDGDILWQKDVGDDILAELIIAGDFVIAGTLQGAIIAFNIMTGETVWKNETDFTLKNGPASDGKNLYWGIAENRIIAVDIQTGKIMREFTVGGSVYSTPVIDGNRIYFGATDGFFYAFDLENGNLLWTHEAESVIKSSPVISGDLLFYGAYKGDLFGVNKNSGKEFWRYNVPGGISADPVIDDLYLVFPVEHRYIYLFRISEN